MLTTGILISGKMSVGVRRTTTGVRIRIRSAITTNVYGLRNAKATIHIENSLKSDSQAGDGAEVYKYKSIRALMRDGAYRI